MTDSERPADVIRKAVNAFVPTAKSRLPISSVSVVKRMLGGLWVGGTIELSKAGARFEPNRLNAALHRDVDAIWIPGATIRSVAHESGFVTDIVVVLHADGELRFRCYGARDVADRFRALLGGLAE